VKAAYDHYPDVLGAHPVFPGASGDRQDVVAQRGWVECRRIDVQALAARKAEQAGVVKEQADGVVQGLGLSRYLA
jgi:hypothetical protein